eukprot:366410-Chlamydomonas_euryale.AAC.16
MRQTRFLYLPGTVRHAQRIYGIAVACCGGACRLDGVPGAARCFWCGRGACCSRALRLRMAQPREDG